MLLLCLVAVMSFGLCQAATENKAKKVSHDTTAIFQTDIDCEHCAQRIMNNIPVLGKGIKDVKVDVPTKQVTVVYDQAKTNLEVIAQGFAKIKIKAEPIQ